MATAPLRIALRRDFGAVSMFLYLPINELTPGFQLNPLNFNLPGNVKADLYGWTGTNVFVPIGKQRLVFNVQGTVQALTPTDFPALPASGASQIINGPSVLGVRSYDTGVSAGDVSPPTMKAEYLRNLLLEWMSDIQSLSYVNVALCIKNWLGEADGRYLQVGGTVTDFQGPTEKAGYPGMYDYSFTFVAGVGA